MGMVFIPASSFLPTVVNKFDILSMDIDDKVEDGVMEEKLSYNGNGGEASMVDDVGLRKDVGYGGGNYNNKFDCGEVKEIGNVREMTKVKLAKELKSLGPIKIVPLGRNKEGGSS
ncbi:hypothetical protein MA16_Dca019659 [Dendrobium catenatum]|uniref:Uncharacterized protein n=1 Tax=Dendrobium catenatum TaxID=906689 RepID=A0A2I0WNK4_9ASPA|nr:hypothetical protein MA16_Dca019659 [Dendrobium catenatum]